MGSYKIRRLQISKSVVEILEKHSLFSCRDVLTLTEVELQAMLGVNKTEANDLLKKISEKCVSEPKIVYDLYMNLKSTPSCGFLSLSLHPFDLLLQGGLPFGCITEFAGPPGVGKTQFCFMISILCATPTFAGGLESNVVFLDTESSFSAERLKSMAEKKFPLVYKHESNLDCLLQKVFVHRVTSISMFKEIVSNLEREVIKNKTKVIIIDSIASLVRKQFGNDGMFSLIERNKLLMEQTAALKDIAQTYNMVVFVTNQITSQYTELDSIALDFDDEYEGTAHQDSDIPSYHLPVPFKKMKMLNINADQVVPALGNTWFHCVNTRLVAQFLNSSVRQLTIAKSPVAPNASLCYLLGDSGIVPTDDDIEFVNISEFQNRTIQTKYNFLNTDITGTGIVYRSSTNKIE